MPFSVVDGNALSIIEAHVKKTWYNDNVVESWRKLPEVPDQSEIMPAVDENRNRNQTEDWFQYQVDPTYENSSRLPVNTVLGPWASKSEYIGAHYQILREDAVASLRNSVKEFKKHPEMNDSGDTCIYTSVHFRGLQLGALGAGFRIEFSHERAGKQILWEQSKRLVQGTIVALSPQRDMFRTICKVCVVAARPIVGGLDQNPPQIDLFWGRSEDAVFDPVEPYVMIESRNGYFEASRHMLVALQKLETEKFNLANHLVDLDNEVKAPEYLEDQPFMDLRTLCPSEEDVEKFQDSPLQNINVLQKFPEIPSSGMDSSQMLACERMLTKRISIVQGPPGTGKTFVSVSAIRVMLANLGPGDPPLIVAAQTNHALDQLLTHVLSFEPNILRLGGRCAKDKKHILERTLYNLKQNTKDIPPNYKRNADYGKLKARIEEIKIAMAPLLEGQILTAESLLCDGIITQKQHDSLHADAGWKVDEEAGRNGLEKWLNGQIKPIPHAPSINFGLPLEETDLEFEQLQKLEQEAEIDEEAGETSRVGDDTEALRGTWIPFRQNFTGKYSGVIVERRIQKYLNSQDLYKIPLSHRGEVYRYFEMLQNAKMLKALRSILKEYQETVDSIRSTKWLNDTRVVKCLGIKLIGCTTTGLSKYRGFLAALDPRTLLIEEAAETLEGKIMAGMIESLQQLILVGDHKQLQAHCNIQSLEDEPYFMAKSMFERLIDNCVEYTMLNLQRRMISKVRELLCIEPDPFYRNLKDHPSVLDRVNVRPPVEGMGAFDTYWFTHSWGEARSEDASRYNSQEAEMVAYFFKYLTLNGVDYRKITVLTFYNGQRKILLKTLKRVFGHATDMYFRVYTVDGYQGEENDVILLSLVRSNMNSDIGFLENKNRLVVALSRARRGLYIFGNAANMTANESSGEIIGRDPLWMPIIASMKRQGRFDFDIGLPITCKNHKRTTWLNTPDQWLGNAGGCDQKCGGLRACGHPCTYRCHPFNHDEVSCPAPCEKILACGHGCSKCCGQECECGKCEKVYDHQTGDMVRVPVDSSSSKNSPQKSCLKNGHFGSHQASPSRRVTFQDSPRKGVFASFDVRNEIGNISQPSTPKTPRSRKGGASPKSSAKSPFNHSKGSELAHASPNKSSIGTPPNNPWLDWDAQKADDDLAKKLRELDAATPKRDPSSMVYKEVHRPVVIENGKRVLSSPVKRTVPRSEASPPPNTPVTSSSSENKFASKLEAHLGLSPIQSGLAEKKPKAARSETLTSFGALSGDKDQDPFVKMPNDQMEEEAQQHAKSTFDIDAFEAIIGRSVPSNLLRQLRQASGDNIQMAINLYFDGFAGTETAVKPPTPLLPAFGYQTVDYGHTEEEECFSCGAERNMLSHPHSFGRCQHCQKMYCRICLKKCKCLKSTAARNFAPSHTKKVEDGFNAAEFEPIESTGEGISAKNQRILEELGFIPARKSFYTTPHVSYRPAATMSPVPELEIVVNEPGSPISDLYDVSPREVERQREAALSRGMNPSSSTNASTSASASGNEITDFEEEEPEEDLITFE